MISMPSIFIKHNIHNTNIVKENIILSCMHQKITDKYEPWILVLSICLLNCLYHLISTMINIKYFLPRVFVYNL